MNDLDKYLPRLQSLWPWEETALVFLNHDATEEFVLGWGTSRGWFAGMTGLDEGGHPASVTEFDVPTEEA
jgi:hypothetical protein